MSYSVGDRLQVSNELCTVRYVGKIAEWSEDDAIGLEWDNASRGRHDGMVNGVRYFNTTNGNSATFIKKAKLVECEDTARTFMQALSAKYGDSLDDIGVTHIGSKKIESFGLAKLTKINNEYSNLKYVSLSKQCIRSIGTYEDVKEIVQQLHSVEELDLACNLLDKVSEVVELCCGLAKLRFLDLSWNVFREVGLGDSCCFNVTKLILGHCCLSVTLLNEILKRFPNLVHLDISGNKLCSIEAIDIPAHVTELIISETGIVELPHSLSSRNITTLVAANNGITSLALAPCTTVRKLDISNNKIGDIRVIDQVQDMFPNLLELRIDKNAFCVPESGDEQFYEIVARVPNIEILNGSFISDALRKESELFFVSKVQSGELSYDKTLPNWERLLKKHQLVESNKHHGTKSLKDLIYTIQVKGNSFEEFELRVLATASVRYLKTMIGTRLNRDLRKVTLTYSTEAEILSTLKYEFVPVSTFSSKNGLTIYLDLDNIED